MWLRRGKAKYRIIVRDEDTRISKSFGVYDVEKIELSVLLDAIREYLTSVQQESTESVQSEAVDWDEDPPAILTRETLTKGGIINAIPN